MSNLVMALAFFVQVRFASTCLKSMITLSKIYDRIQGTKSKHFSQWGALALWFLGGRKRDAVEVICTEITLKNSDSKYNLRCL